MEISAAPAENWEITIDQCWPGVLRLISQIPSGRRWISARTLRKIDFPPKVTLSCPRRENMASRRRPFGRFYSGKEAPKPRWDKNSYGFGTACFFSEAKKLLNFFAIIIACTAMGLRRKEGRQRGSKERTKGADWDYNYNQLLSRYNDIC